jgi:hypothetical protein
MDEAHTSTRRLLVIRALAIASAVAAVIHFAVAGEHFQEYWAFGVFMLVMAWLQLTWAVGIMLRPSRQLLALGGIINAGVVAVYIVTRTAGDVIGPTPHAVEPVGFGDAFCTVCEALIVAGVLVLLARPLLEPVTRGMLWSGSAAVGALAMVLLSVSLVDGGSEMVMTMSAAAPAVAATQQVSLATDSPAGPVTMPDASMQMAPGMKMAGGPCIAAPTPAQEAATVRLVNATWAAARKYQSLATAEAAGFRPLTPTGKPVVHYISVANYRATALGGPVIDPSAPQSLVYANTPNGAVLAAVMYIESPLSDSTPPDPGGCLTQWHVHTNLCFRDLRVVGIMNPACPAGSVNHITQPMMHVWFVPIPGGPTAVDAPDAQVVRAAEQVASPHNGRA